MASEKPPDLQQGGQALPSVTGQDGDKRNEREDRKQAEFEIWSTTQKPVKGPEVLRDGHDYQENAGQGEEETAGDESQL